LEGGARGGGRGGANTSGGATSTGTTVGPKPHKRKTRKKHHRAVTPTAPPTTTETTPPPTTSPTRNCDPNYKGACLDPNAPDYDCAGGSGDGPKYVQGPIEVVGSDHYGLDRDGDGVACE